MYVNTQSAVTQSFEGLAGRTTQPFGSGALKRFEPNKITLRFNSLANRAERKQLKHHPGLIGYRCFQTAAYKWLDFTQLCTKTKTWKKKNTLEIPNSQNALSAKFRQPHRGSVRVNYLRLHTPSITTLQNKSTTCKRNDGVLPQELRPLKGFN